MICTIVGGAAAFEVIVKVPVVWPAGMVMDDGTWATDGSLEKNRTTVGPVSAKPRSTVPVVDSPPAPSRG